MLRIISTIACSLILASTLHAQDGKATDVALDAIDVNSEIDRKLIAYCTGALLRERGLSCSPFAGNSDKWILSNLLPEKNFLSAVDAARSTATFAGEALPRERVRGVTDIVGYYQHKDKYSDKLMQTLTDDQKRKLPGVYLHTEGLIALCRPEFLKLFDEKESQERIRQMANETWSKQASEVHRAIFGLRDGADAPTLEFELRQISYVLDCQIVNMLTKAEREKLLELLSRSRSIQRVTRGAPAY